MTVAERAAVGGTEEERAGLLEAWNQPMGTGRRTKEEGELRLGRGDRVARESSESEARDWRGRGVGGRKRRTARYTSQ